MAQGPVHPGGVEQLGQLDGLGHLDPHLGGARGGGLGQPQPGPVTEGEELGLGDVLRPRGAVQRPGRCGWEVLLIDRWGPRGGAGVAGAVDAKEYIAMMEAAGFTDISVKPVFFDKQTVDDAMGDMKLDLGSYSKEDIYKAVYSAKITAYKPA